MNDTRLPLDRTAYATMLICSVLWGLQQVTIKLAAAGVSPVMQGAIRSIVATLLLLAWARWRGMKLFDSDGSLAAGSVVGVLFALEFLFIYFGLGHTLASRMVVFIYLAPVLTAVAAAWFLPSERLSGLQWTGVVLAFAGIVVAFSDGLFSGDRATLLGDACGVIAAAMWASTTILIRSTALARVSATKTLAYQLAISAAVLPVFSLALGEPGIVRLDALTVSMLFYQAVIVAFASYLAWFWLLTRYYATRLSVFAFLAPLFGVLFGVWILGERLSAGFALAALMVCAGIALVNARRG